MRLLWLALASGACATLADSGGGERALPNARAGPFREIRTEELGNTRSAPYALRDDDDFPRDVSLLDVDGDPATLPAHGYAALTVIAEDEEPDPTRPSNAIVRFFALDGRSFDRSFETVLEPLAAWEGGVVAAPAVLRAGGAVRLYYAAAGGIGLATSSDGVAFERLDAPVLSAAPSGWERGATPASPAVVELPDGGFHMFYEVALEAGGRAIGEARSGDGIVWQRVGEAPVLAPSGPSGDPARPRIDAASAGTPCAVFATTPTGRLVEYLYYMAVDELGEARIALAARFGTDGPFVRAEAPVFATGLEPREPWVARYPDFSLLFVTQKAGSSEALAYPAVAVGVAPADVDLPPPEPR